MLIVLIVEATLYLHGCMYQVYQIVMISNSTYTQEVLVSRGFLYDILDTLIQLAF